MTEYKETFLEKALKLAPFEGWNEAMYLHAAREAGLTQPQAQLLFPHGVSDMLDSWAQDADARMIKEYSSWPEFPKETIGPSMMQDGFPYNFAAQNWGDDVPHKPVKIHHRIMALLKLRLEMNLKHREAVRRAQAYYLLHPAVGFTVLSRTADEIWHLAGDTSTDLNWYSKRFLLANVYASTQLHWLDDQSEGRKNTWAFMERRIQDVLKIGKVRRKIEDGIKKIFAPLYSASQ